MSRKGKKYIRELYDEISQNLKGRGAEIILEKGFRLNRRTDFNVSEYVGEKLSSIELYLSPDSLFICIDLPTWKSRPSQELEKSIESNFQTKFRICSTEKPIETRPPYFNYDSFQSTPDKVAENIVNKLYITLEAYKKVKESKTYNNLIEENNAWNKKLALFTEKIRSELSQLINNLKEENNLKV